MQTADEKRNFASLLKSGANVINFGMAGFYDDLKKQEIPVVQMDWTPKTVNSNLLAKLKMLKKS